jgi:hypothetical protein
MLGLIDHHRMIGRSVSLEGRRDMSVVVTQRRMSATGPGSRRFGFARIAATARIDAGDAVAALPPAEGGLC